MTPTERAVIRRRELVRVAFAPWRKDATDLVIDEIDVAIAELKAATLPQDSAPLLESSTDQP
jgi:hypothetical protein